MADPVQAATLDPKWFRQVLGQYPTGVCAITAMQGDGTPAAMVVGSFTSVSLNPPLVAFFPDKGSSSWPKIAGVGKFCVNILTAEQEPVCRRLASKDPDKFSDIPYRTSPGGAPVLDGVVAWIDCDIDRVEEAGDHFIVLGLVQSLGIADGGLPLLFFQGGYGRFAASSVSARDTSGALADQLRLVDHARPAMERIAVELSARCIATAQIGDELVVLASAGEARRSSLPALVGQRLPFVPPTGSVFAAWMPEPALQHWFARAGSPERVAECRAALARVRERGFSVGMVTDAQRRFVARLEKEAQHPTGRSRPSDLEELVTDLCYDPADLAADRWNDVRLISAPVFAVGGRVAYALTLHDFAKPPSGTSAAAYALRLVDLAGTLGAP